MIQSALLGLLIAGAPAAGLAAVPDGFVYRQGTNFMLNGKPYYFGGAICYDLFTYGDGWSMTTSNQIEAYYMNKSAIDAQMARMQADGVAVVRTWAWDHENWHGFEPAKGFYNEAQFREFDYILVSASNHNMRLVVTLENNWNGYGGIDARLQWEGLTGGDPGHRIFFTNGPAIQGYVDYVSYFINRTNHYTGVQYKNDPTIFSWELMNEPRYQGESPAEDIAGTKLRAWVDAMGAFIKGIDTNHMLDAGIEGQGSAYGYGIDCGAPFVYIQQSPYIDFCSAHLYPTEPWANMSIEQTTNLMAMWAHDAHVTVGKPFFLGEFNVLANSVFGTRSNYWAAIYDAIEKLGIGGSTFWWYSGPDSNVDPMYGVLSGAPELAAFRASAYVNVIFIPPPAFQSFRMAGETATMTWTAIAGKTYQLQVNSGLWSTNWSNTGPALTAATNTLSASDVIGSYPRRFYRVVLLGPPNP